MLVERYGAEFVSILEHGQGLESLWEVEARHAIRSTMCLHLTDFMTRRVPLFLADKMHGEFFLQAISLVFQAELGWKNSQLQEEIQLYHEHVKRELHWK